ncbi:arginine--tRNA ligase [Mycoplasmatota bacterium]|nr:arginine--tRNA ligase [Mycoplasmatota bacterium]
MIDSIKENIKLNLESKYSGQSFVVESPKHGHADLAIPLFGLAKAWKMNPKLVFDKVKEDLDDPSIEKILFTNGFLNIFLHRNDYAIKVLNELNEFKSLADKNETVVIDYSSPNIAKSFSVGHLRSTVIGNALKNIYEKSGYKVVGVNHLGDWGTQFGKMIVAYNRLTKPLDLSKDPIKKLQALYVGFHEDAKEDPSLEVQAREVFKALENGNEAYLTLWKQFRDLSLEEFMNMYDILNVSFDAYEGEAFYNDKMDEVVTALDEKGLLKIDDGATIVDLGEDLPPALIKRSDGATLYLTRDLAALKYRHDHYGAKKVIYVVGNEQQLHFKQLTQVAKLLEYPVEIEHVNFGLVMLDGKKMSTRGGKTKRLEDVILQAINDAKDAITEKNPSLSQKDEVAKAVGVGAIVFNDLKNERHLNVDFSLENMLKFEGQTGPYLQYSSVRIESILKDTKIDMDKVDAQVYAGDIYFELIKLLDQFQSNIIRAKDLNAPSVIAKYAISLAQAFNSFYGQQKVIVDDLTILNSNLYFVKTIQLIINECLNLLGIKSLKEM